MKLEKNEGSFLTDLVFVSIVTRSHYADARTLATTVRRFHPGRRHYIIVVDGLSDADLPPAQDNECLVPAVDLLDRHEFLLLCFAYLPVEICCILKPLALKYALRHGAEIVVYLDCDMSLHGALPESILPTDRFPIALTPHVIGAYGAKEAWRYFLHQAGHFNAGFVSLYASPESERFCDAWWSLCKLHGVGNRHRESTFYDQGWLALAALQLLEFVKPVDDTSINIAPWNADQRREVKEPILIHWSGEVLGVVRRGNLPALPTGLEAMFQGFLVDFKKSQLAVSQYVVPNRFATFNSGQPVPLAARRWVLECLRKGRRLDFDPFDNRGRVLAETRHHYFKWVVPELRERLGWLRQELASLF